MWTDNETTLDLIGFQVHADLIKSVITNPELLPITIGVFGDWGSGKTSIMRMLEKDLNILGQTNKDILCIYFNGWLFEGYDDAKSALLTSILKEIEDKILINEKVKTKISQLLQSIDWMRLVRFGFNKIAFPAIAAYLTGGTSIIPLVLGAGNKFLDEFKHSGGDLSQMNLAWDEIIKKEGINKENSGVKQFRENFSELLEETKIKSLVILVDDLDRCTPQRIIDNLEAIKLFLSVEKTAFVIGADPRIVEYAIASVYGGNNLPSDHERMNNSDFIKDYLEKLIQVPYHLPRLSPAEVQTYMTLLFSYQGLKEDEFEIIYKAYREHYNEDRYRVFGFGNINSLEGITLSEELSKNLTFCETVANTITEGLKGNPRQIKRFLNAFVLRKKLADVAKLPDFRDDVLVKLMVLEYSRPKYFEQLFNWQTEQNGFPEQIKVLENVLINGIDIVEADKELMKNWFGDFHKKWIAIEPYLSEIDLRDYFWVARDRLQTTMSGVTLVSPFLRNLLNELISGETKNLQRIITQISELSIDDLNDLFILIKKHIQKNPEDVNAYNAIFELIENNISNSIEFLDEILTCVPENKIPPAIGIKIVILIQKNEIANIILYKTIEEIKESQSPFAEALKMRNK